MAAVDGLHIAAGGGENGLKSRLAHPVEGIQHHPQLGVPDGLHVDAADDAVQVLVQRVEFHDEAGFYPILVAETGNLISLLLVFLHLEDPALHVGGLMLIRVPSPFGKDFKAVVEGGVVAGGDHHAVVQVMGHGVKHDQGSGGRTVHKTDGDPLRRQHFRRPLNSLFGQKTPVIADDQLHAGIFLLHFSRHGLRKNADIGFCKIIADDGAPSSGAEMNAHKKTSCF